MRKADLVEFVKIALRWFEHAVSTWGLRVERQWETVTAPKDVSSRRVRHWS